MATDNTTVKAGLDAKALEAARAKAESLLGELSGALRESYIEVARAHTVAYLSALPHAGQPGIKALEWQPSVHSTEMQIATHELLNVAYGVGDSTTVKGWSCLFRGYEFLGDYETASNAKAAAQADYEARIRSAHVPTTSPAKGGAEVEALRKAASPLVSRADSYDAPSFDEGPDDDGVLVQVPLGELRALRVALAALRTSAPVGQQAKEGEANG